MASGSIRHIVWDWNGTLLDDFPQVVLAAGRAARDVLGMGLDADDYRRCYARPVRRLYENLAGRSLTEAEWSALNQRYHDTYRAQLTSVRPAPDARAALAAVEAAGITQSLLSMWAHEELVALVGELGLGAALIGLDGLPSSGAGDRKAPWLARHLERLRRGPLPGLEAGEVVVVGDSLDDAAAAAEVGARAVLVDGGSHHVADLERTGSPVAGTLLGALALVGIGGS
jgi:phosphoglycolate phosphatase-like HAD superfamily hydrolase